MIKGIDVSSYQSESYATAGLDFVFVKATEGTSYVNPKMTAQAARARKAGLVLGFYHFLRPGDMKAQAAYFVAKAASVEGDILAADWEDPGVSCAQKDIFVREVQRLRGSTHRIILYCNRDYWLNRDTTSFAADGLWIADYLTAGKPKITAKWLIHQYTSTPVDTNVAQFASRAAMKTWAAKGASTPAPKPPAPKPPVSPSPVVKVADGPIELGSAVPLGWVKDMWPTDAGLADGAITVATALGSTYGYARAAYVRLAQLEAKLDAILAKLG